MMTMSIEQSDLYCTLMGVLRGVTDYYGISVTTPMLYGLTGHAFLINIHEALCPSGPYCWNRAPFFRLARNIGLDIRDLGFFSPASPPSERATVESTVRSCLDRRVPCSLINMESQLITGFDRTGFLTTQPWAPHVDFPQKHITFGTWEELGEEIHMNVFTFTKTEAAEPKQAVVDAATYAVDLHENSCSHTSPSYGIGPSAYGNWIDAVKNGAGESHGNWWNGTVWAECREMAGAFFWEIAETIPEAASPAQRLSDAYSAIGKDLERASSKEMPAEEKVPLLEHAMQRETACIDDLRDLVRRLA